MFFKANLIFDIIFFFIAFLFLSLLVLLLSGIFLQTSFSLLLKQLNNIELWDSIFLSFKISFIVILINIIVGTPISYLLSFKKNAYTILDVLATLPLTMSPLVIGFAVLITFGSLNPIGKFLAEHGIKFVFTIQGIVIVQVIISLPFFINILKESFDGISRDIINVSKTLGANTSIIFFKIIIPLSIDGMIAGSIMSFSRSAGEFAATQMVSGVIPNVTETAPIMIFIRTSYGDYPAAIGAASILMVLSFISLLIFKIFYHKAQKR